MIRVHLLQVMESMLVFAAMCCGLAAVMAAGCAPRDAVRHCDCSPVCGCCKCVEPCQCPTCDCCNCDK